MTDFTQRMQALRQRFIDQARGEAAEIERHAAANEWTEVRDLSHRMAGRAGMFGFAATTDHARTLEEAVDDATAPEALRALADALVRCLRTLEE